MPFCIGWHGRFRRELDRPSKPTQELGYSRIGPVHRHGSERDKLPPVAAFGPNAGVPFSIIDAVRLGFLGCLFNLISAGSVGGDLFKAIAAARQAERKRPEVIGSVIIDRAMGLLGLVLVAAISLEFLRKGPLSEQLNWIRLGAWGLGLVGVVTLCLLVAFGRFLPIGWLRKIPVAGNAIHRMAQAGLIFDQRAKLMLTMMSVSVLVHSLLTFSTFLISAALYSERPTLEQHFLVIPPAMAAGALPLTPGGLGVQEAAIHELFSQLPNVPPSFSGLITAAMYRLMTFVVAGIGAIFYFYASNDLRRIVHPQESQPVAKGPF